jgi:hypothetical protein
MELCECSPDMTQVLLNDSRPATPSFSSEQLLANSAKGQLINKQRGVKCWTCR